MTTPALLTLDELAARLHYDREADPRRAVRRLLRRLETIRRMGGWKSLRMVERYVAVSDEHMAAAAIRLRA